MRFFAALPFVALSAALVFPDEEVVGQLVIEPRPVPESAFSKLPFHADEAANEIEKTFTDVIESSKTILDQAINYAKFAGQTVSKHCNNAAFDAKSWIESAATDIEDFGKDHGHHGHHGHHDKPNETVYQLISKSKYTTKLAALINEYEDVVELLNGTSANFTIFAPTGPFNQKDTKRASWLISGIRLRV